MHNITIVGILKNLGKLWKTKGDKKLKGATKFFLNKNKNPSLIF